MAQATNTTLGEIKLSGDIMPSDANAPQLTPSGVVPAAYPVVQKIHVDSKGRTLWIGSLSSSELTEDILPSASDTVAGALKLGNPFTTDGAGTLSIADASASTKGIMKVGTGLYVNQSSGAVDVDLPIGSTTAYGGIKVTNLFSVAGDGTLSVNGAEVLDQLTSPATASSTGVVKVGQYFSNSGALAVDIPYASSSVYGTVKAGTGSGFFGLNALENTLSAVTALAGSPFPGVVLPAADQLYMNTGNGTLNVHACHPNLWGWLYGVSGPNIALDNATSTLSATYTFDSFATDATTSVLGRVQVGDRIDVDVNGTISLPNASADYGVVKVTGRVFKIDGNGKLYWDINYIANSTYAGHVMPNGSSIYFSDLPTATISADLTHSSITATAAQKGQVQIGSGISVDAGVISIPDATTSSKGLVQIGSGINVTNGVISIDTYSLPTATTSSKGGVVADGIGIGTLSGELYANAATTTTPGVVRISSSTFLDMLPDGTAYYKCAPATTSQIGYVYTSGADTNGLVMSGTAGVTLSLDSTTQAKLFRPDSVTTGFEPVGKIGIQAIADQSEKGIVIGVGPGIDVVNGIMSVAKASKTNHGIAKTDNLTMLNNSGLISLKSDFNPFNSYYGTNHNYYYNVGQIEEVQRYTALTTISDNGTTRVLELPASATNSIIVFEPPQDTVDNFSIQIKATANFLNIGSSDMYFIYKVVYKTGTTTPINIRIADYEDSSYKVSGSSTYVGAGRTEGQFIVYRLRRHFMNSKNYIQVAQWPFF